MAGYSGDGSAATAAKLEFPEGRRGGRGGDLFIADSGNNVDPRGRFLRARSPRSREAARRATAATGDTPRRPAQRPRRHRGGRRGQHLHRRCGNNVVREVAQPLYWDPAGPARRMRAAPAHGRPTAATSTGTTRFSARTWPGATAAPQSSRARRARSPCPARSAPPWSSWTPTTLSTSTGTRLRSAP